MRGDIPVFGGAVRPRSVFAAAALFMLLYYAIPLTSGSYDLVRPVLHGFTFNSMLAHLLAGQCDVDPQAIGDEGFVHGGRTYAYFGVFPALLRAPLLLFGSLRTADITRLSCLIAASLMGFCKLAALAEVHRSAESRGARSLLFWPLAFSFLLGGAQIQFLKASIYQEVVTWSGALGAAFVYCSIRGLITERNFSTHRLAQMAALAGLALLTRVSMGVALYAALGLLLVVLAWQAGGRAEQRLAATVRELSAVRLALPLALLLGLAALCGLVNYGRWGNPLTFVDFHQHIIIHELYPDRIPRLERYGEFNVARLWFGLIYYFLPVWIWIRPDGKLLFDPWQQRFVESAELPPSSFFLSDPLLIGLCAVLIWSLWHERRRSIDARQSAAILLGLSTAPFLMLIAISMSFRYRMEFYPLFELGALLGLFMLSSRPAPARARTKATVWAGAISGIVACHILLLLYKLSAFGPATRLVEPDGVVAYYLRQLAAHAGGG
jgi:hypothetical protein